MATYDHTIDANLCINVRGQFELEAPGQGTHLEANDVFFRGHREEFVKRVVARERRLDPIGAREQQESFSDGETRAAAKLEGVGLGRHHDQYGMRDEGEGRDHRDDEQGYGDADGSEREASLADGIRRIRAAELGRSDCVIVSEFGHVRSLWCSGWSRACRCLSASR